MLGMDRAYVIRHKWHHEGLSIRQIARDLGVSRNTVRKYVADDDEPHRREAGLRQQPVLDAVRAAPFYGSSPRRVMSNRPLFSRALRLALPSGSRAA